MAYDETLADRIREHLGDEPGLIEMRMFGGLAFLVGGHMAVAASGQGGLMVRCDPDRVDDLLARPGARWPEMRGRQMSKGWVVVAAEGTETDDDLAFWIQEALAYATKATG